MGRQGGTGGDSKLKRCIQHPSVGLLNAGVVACLGSCRLHVGCVCYKRASLVGEQLGKGTSRDSHTSALQLVVCRITQACRQSDLEIK
jgi:hypothetical protein